MQAKRVVIVLIFIFLAIMLAGTVVAVVCTYFLDKPEETQDELISKPGTKETVIETPVEFIWGRKKKHQGSSYDSDKPPPPAPAAAVKVGVSRPPRDDDGCRETDKRNDEKDDPPNGPFWNDPQIDENSKDNGNIDGKGFQDEEGDVDESIQPESASVFEVIGPELSAQSEPLNPVPVISSSVLNDNLGAEDGEEDLLALFADIPNSDLDDQGDSLESTSLSSVENGNNDDPNASRDLLVKDPYISASNDNLDAEDGEEDSLALFADIPSSDLDDQGDSLESTSLSSSEDGNNDDRNTSRKLLVKDSYFDIVDHGTYTIPGSPRARDNDQIIKPSSVDVDGDGAKHSQPIGRAPSASYRLAFFEPLFPHSGQHGKGHHLGLSKHVKSEMVAIPEVSSEEEENSPVSPQFSNRPIIAADEGWPLAIYNILQSFDRLIGVVSRVCRASPLVFRLSRLKHDAITASDHLSAFNYGKRMMDLMLILLRIELEESKPVTVNSQSQSSEKIMPQCDLFSGAAPEAIVLYKYLVGEEHKKISENPYRYPDLVDEYSCQHKSLEALSNFASQISGEVGVQARQRIELYKLLSKDLDGHRKFIIPEMKDFIEALYSWYLLQSTTKHLPEFPGLREVRDFRSRLARFIIETLIERLQHSFEESLSEAHNLHVIEYISSLENISTELNFNGSIYIANGLPAIICAYDSLNKSKKTVTG